MCVFTSTLSTLPRHMLSKTSISVFTEADGDTVHLTHTLSSHLCDYLGSIHLERGHVGHPEAKPVHFDAPIRSRDCRMLVAKIR